MLLGLEVGLGPGRIVLAFSSPTERGTAAPTLLGPLCSGTVAHLTNCRTLVGACGGALLQRERRCAQERSCSTSSPVSTEMGMTVREYTVLICNQPLSRTHPPTLSGTGKEYRSSGSGGTGR